MTENELLELLRTAVETNKSQVKVAKMLGYSPATISQIMGGSYQGAMDKVLARVEEIFGTRTVECPVLGEIRIGRCVTERRAPFSAANPVRVRLYRACRNCENNTDYTYL